MARIDVPFVVEKQHITQPSKVELMSGGRNHFYATFNLCDTWEDIFNIKAVFYRDDISVLMSLTEGEDGLECVIPWEVMTEKGAFEVGIFGDDRLLTNLVYVKVGQGCMSEGNEPTPPTPDWFSETDKKIEDLSNNLDVPKEGGIETLSYSMAFTVMNINPSKKTYTLDSVEGLEVGDVYSVHLLSYYKDNPTHDYNIQGEDVGKITNIEGNVVTVDVFFDTVYGLPLITLTEEMLQERIEKDGYDKEFNTFKINAKPLVGTRKIGDGCYAGGIKTKTLSKGGFSHGIDCETYGSFGSTMNRETKAAYCANARNYNTHAKGHFSNADGYVTIAGSERQNVNGQFNIEDTEGKYSNIVGNGKSDAERSNSHTLDWEGNAWYAGNLRVGKDESLVVSQNFLAELLLAFGIGTGVSISSNTRIEIEDYANKAYTDKGHDLYALGMSIVKSNAQASGGKFLHVYAYKLGHVDRIVHKTFVSIPIIISESGSYDISSVIHYQQDGYRSKVHIFIDESEIIVNDGSYTKDISNLDNDIKEDDFTGSTHRMCQYDAKSVYLGRGLHLLKFQVDPIILYGDGVTSGINFGTQASLDYIEFTKIQDDVPGGANTN